MTKTESSNDVECTIVMDAEAVNEAINRIAQELIAENPDIESVALLGILRRGRPMADRLAARIEDLAGVRPDVGTLATTLYRDDLRAGSGGAKIRAGETHFNFNVNDRTVVLVDDVIAAGRTVRAALDEVMDYGRPRRIQLACLVDRGLRELPIQPDYLGWSLATRPSDHVSVRFAETDGEDIVLLERTGAEEAVEE